MTCPLFSRRRFLAATCCATLAVSAPAAPAPPATTATLVQQAMALTAQGKLAAAETLYREATDLDPEPTLPLLSRFYARTGRTTESVALLGSPRALALSPLGRARIALAARETTAAQALLQPILQTGQPASELYGAASLAANIARDEGQPAAAAEVLARAIAAPALTANQRRDLFQRLIATRQARLLDAQFAKLVEALAAPGQLSFISLREMINEGLILLGADENFAGFFRRIGQEAASGSPGAAWLHAVASIRRGDPQAALPLLRAMNDSTTSTASAAMRAYLLEEEAMLAAGQPARILKIYEQLLASAPDQDRVRLNLAQLYYKDGRIEKALQLLAPIRSEALDEGLQGVFKNLYLTCLGRTDNLKAVVEGYLEQAKGTSYERARQLAEAPLINLPADKYSALLAELAQREASATTATKPASADATTRGVLNVLRMSVENRRGNSEGVLQALRAYVAAEPLNVTAAQELAEAESQRAYQIATADPASSPSQTVLKESGDTAARALWRSIELRPYTPEPYIGLMALYTLYGQPEKAKLVPLALADRTTATAEEVQLAAYVYAQSGADTQALPLYERAIALDPQNMRYKLNYAAALSRTPRFREADAIYRKLLAEGHNGRQYHTHQIIPDAWNLAQLRGFRDEFEQFLLGLITKKDQPDHDAFLLDAGKAMLTVHRPERAMPFFEALKEQYPADKLTAEDFILQTHIALGNFEKADELLARQEREASGTLALIQVRSNRAALAAGRGQVAEGIAAYEKLAADFPSKREAVRGLLTAAQNCAREGRLRQGRSLAVRFLRADSGDIDAEQAARELIQRIDRQDFPTEVLMKAATEGAPSK